MSKLPALGHNLLDIVVQVVSLATNDLVRTLLTTENIKFSACVHVALSCSRVACETQGTGG